jgi:hypothetical protein
MNDRELLELAAKAAGINWYERDDVWFSTNDFVRSDWNPLSDDGDALRLAVKLKIDIRNFHSDEVAAQFKLPDQLGWSEHSEDRSTEPYAATRRAIVRAAAQLADASNEIGKGMK